LASKKIGKGRLAMSEKIKKIADISHGLAVQEYYTRLAVEHPSQVIFYDIFNQQFAELIVRECMNVLDPGENQVIARFQARQWLAEHFGDE
jgi:hypothetical protein